jgi:hypothetical protein
MKRSRTILLVALCLSLVQFTVAQTPTETASALPRLVRFGGAVKSPDGGPLAGVAGITFALYSEQTGGAPLWLETQNVTADSSGRYTVLLGATKTEGLPAELFTSERAHWVGVQVQGQPEQPRVLLVSAPYALKAGDAETIGGLPPSAFVLAAPSAGGSVAAGAPAASAAASDAAPATATDVTTTGGTAGYLPYFTGAATVLDSVVSQSGSGSTAQVQVGGELKLPATGTATGSPGFNSEHVDLVASAYNTGAGEASAQTFQLQAEPVGSGTATTSGVLSLLYGSGTATPAETGLQIASNGVITFASGQTLPAVTGSVDMTGNLTLGGGVTATTTVSASTIQGAVVQATGSVSGSGFYTLGDQLLCGNYNDQDTVVGFGALNSLCSGSGDGGTNTAVGFKSLAGAAGGGGTAVGAYALSSSPVSPDNTALGAYALGRLGSNGNAGYNTASGAYALYNNQAGGYNTASGYNALLANGQSTGGNNNAAYGFQALENNSSGSNNTGVGYCAGAVGTFCSTGNPNMTGSSNTFVGSQAGLSTSSVVNNATAIGANAAVGASNALVLGSIAGVNGATASTSVGIGTPTPGATLEVNGTAKFDGLVTFAPGQTFPGGSGSGTVTSISAGAGLTASPSPITTSGTLSITPNACAAGQALTALPFTCTPFATLGSDTFKGSLAVDKTAAGAGGNITAAGTVSGNVVDATTSLNIGGYPVVQTTTASSSNFSAGIGAGFNGGSLNTAVGHDVLFGNTGSYNTAVGGSAMFPPPCSGNGSLCNNGNYNTAVGYSALENNATGSANTAIGYQAGPDSASTNLSNSTAIGASATVSQNNTLVLGQTAAGSPGASWVDVGVGTAVPGSTMELYANVSGGLGPTLTLTNAGGGTGPGASLDFNTFPPDYGSGYNPTARIEAIDNGNFGSNLVFYSNQYTGPSYGLQANMNILGVGGVLIGGGASLGAFDYSLGALTATANNNLEFGQYGVAAYGGFNSGYGGGGGVMAQGGYQGDGIDAYPGTNGGCGQDCPPFYAGNFQGNVEITGTLNGMSPQVKMDDPLDPANKYLFHASVGSSEMKNIYDGTVTTDSQGLATVQLPEWFEALNTDFRYQLTVIGQFAQAIVNGKVANHQFSIRTDKPNVEVSWQITGVRQDAYAKANPLVVEQEKDARERGYYIHPELYGAPEEQGVEWARHPETMKNIRETRARQLAESQKRGGATRAATQPLAKPPGLKETPAPVLRHAPAQKPAPASKPAPAPKPTEPRT